MINHNELSKNINALHRMQENNGGCEMISGKLDQRIELVKSVINQNDMSDQDEVKNDNNSDKLDVLNLKDKDIERDNNDQDNNLDEIFKNEENQGDNHNNESKNISNLNQNY